MNVRPPVLLERAELALDGGFRATCEGGDPGGFQTLMPQRCPYAAAFKCQTLPDARDSVKE